MSSHDDHATEASVERQKISESFTSALDFVAEKLEDAGSLDRLEVETVLSLLILNIVDHPQDMRVNVAKAARSVILEFDVHQEDKGKVIGKYGHTIESFRRLARTILGDEDVEYHISVLEDKRRRSGSTQSSRPNNSRPRRRR